MRGLLSPPKPTPSNPVGGEVVYVSAPNPLCVEEFPGIPACTMLGNAHGDCIEKDAKPFVREAFRWLVPGAK